MLDQDRLDRFQESREYRTSYIASRVRLAVASQIRALRDQFSETQAEFAQRIKKPQSVVSRLENPEYGRMSVQTLLDIAEALDITIVVKFMSFDEFFTLLDDDQVSLERLQVSPFSETKMHHEQIRESANVVSFGLRTKVADERYEQITTGIYEMRDPEIRYNRPLYDHLAQERSMGTRA